MFIDDVVLALNWTIVPPGSPVIGTPPFQLPEADHRPFAPPVQIWVAPSAGAAPISANAKTVATEQAVPRIVLMRSLPLDRYAGLE